MADDVLLKKVATIKRCLRRIDEEAAVIQHALNQGMQIVCIDESVGRRIARLSGLYIDGITRDFAASQAGRVSIVHL